jgi:hypothetical protein
MDKPRSPDGNGLPQPSSVKMRPYMVAVMFLVGCASSGELVPVAYEFLDHPSERRVEVVYRNDSTHAMCLLPEHWPNQAGKVMEGARFVQLVIGQQRFPIENFNTGYCPQGCETRVAPGHKISASISYDDFKLPTALETEPKSLDFSPVAYLCRR